MRWFVDYECTVKADSLFKQQCSHVISSKVLFGMWLAIEQSGLCDLDNSKDIFGEYVG